MFLLQPAASVLQRVAGRRRVPSVFLHSVLRPPVSRFWFDGPHCGPDPKPDPGPDPWTDRPANCGAYHNPYIRHADRFPNARPDREPDVEPDPEAESEPNPEPDVEPDEAAYVVGPHLESDSEPHRMRPELARLQHNLRRWQPSRAPSVSARKPRHVLRGG